MSSYLIGEPKHVKIKYNHRKALKRIQPRFKVNRTEPETRTQIRENIGGDEIKRQACQYYISRKVPLGVESIEHIIIKEGDEIDALIDMYVKNENYEAKIIGDVVYDENDSSSFDCYFNSGCEGIFSIDQDNLNDVMNEAVAVIHKDIDADRDRMNIIGINKIRYKPIITEPN